MPCCYSVAADDVVPMDAMTTTEPTYPLDACNDNGPYPQDVAVRWAMFGESSARPPSLADITINGMVLNVSLSGQSPNTLHVITPGDDAGTYPQINTGSAGGGSTSYTYTAPGSYHVVVARDEGGQQTVIATNDVDAVGTRSRR